MGSVGRLHTNSHPNWSYVVLALCTLNLAEWAGMSVTNGLILVEYRWGPEPSYTQSINVEETKGTRE